MSKDTVSPLPMAGAKLATKVSMAAALSPSSTDTVAPSKTNTGAVGAPPQAWNRLEELRGVGAAVLKSAALSLLSVQPASSRIAAVALAIPGAGPLPSKQLAEPPMPRKSWIAAPVGQAPESAEVLLTRATLPLVPPIAVPPITSGVGSGVVPPPPAACWIR